jgi:hypothetical protein
MGPNCRDFCWETCAFRRVQFPCVSIAKPVAAVHVSCSRNLSDLNMTFPMPTADWTPENGYPSNATVDTLPWRALGVGVNLGLTLVLDAEADQFNCSTSASVGFKVKSTTSDMGRAMTRLDFDPGSVHVGLVVEKVALGQVFPRVLQFSSVSLIPPVISHTENGKKIIFIPGWHNKPQGCGKAVVSAAGPFLTHTKKTTISDIN